MTSIIYKITNTVNSKIYVGKTSKTAEQRLKRHFINSKTGNTYLYKAMRKHGIENFIVEVIEYTNLPNERETFWIMELNPEYNMTKGGDGGDTSNSINYKLGMANRVHPHNPTYGMLGKRQSDKFIESIKKSNRCPVVCDDIQYDSVGAAQDAYPGISIRKRLDNPKYPNFYRLRERTQRK